MPSFHPGTMNRFEMSIPSLLAHAGHCHGAAKVTTLRADGPALLLTYADVLARVRRLADGLRAKGVAQGDRVGTLLLNDHRHFELFYAVPAIGAVCHTLNPRCSPEQLRYIIEHAGDSLVIYDERFEDLVQRVRPHVPGVRQWLAIATVSAVYADDPVYEALIDAGGREQMAAWPELDENAASGMCYTSGTTGHPKGVVYTHRSTVMHAMAMALPNALCVSSRDVVMMLSPMFHVMGWGLPFVAAAMGAEVVLAGNQAAPGSLYVAMERHGVTAAAAVPTIWIQILDYMDARGLRFSTFKKALTGGSHPPGQLVARMARHGVELIDAWGMTETSPLGLVRKYRPDDVPVADPDLSAQPIFGLQARVIDADCRPVTADGTTPGALQVRGNWVTASYFKGPPHEDTEGWFTTGDLAVMGPDHGVRIVDRDKDLIKSGGEWISSPALEDVARRDARVAEVAVVAVPHPRWGERPILVAVRTDESLCGPSLLKLYEGVGPKWWRPEKVFFVDELPKSSTGKVLKGALRAAYRQVLDEGVPPASLAHAA